MKQLLIGAMLIVSSSLTAQIQAVEDFLDRYPNLKKYYIYQSTLRMLNQEGDEDFNKLIKDIRKINAYIAEGDSQVASTHYSTMLDNLESEGFEVYAQAILDGKRINLVGREKGKNSYFVLALRDNENFALLEMDGKLDLAYLTALDDIDFSKLEDLLISEGGENGE